MSDGTLGQGKSGSRGRILAAAGGRPPVGPAASGSRWYGPKRVAEGEVGDVAAVPHRRDHGKAAIERVPGLVSRVPQELHPFAARRGITHERRQALAVEVADFP